MRMASMTHGRTVGGASSRASLSLSAARAHDTSANKEADMSFLQNHSSHVHRFDQTTHNT